MNTAVATADTAKLPEPVARRGLDEAQWRTLKNNLFPGAKSDSILMVVDYCRARKLDPLKKPCHIVPMKVKDQQTGEYNWRDVVMPGIYEYRTTAQRTGDYLGHAKPEYGEFAERFGVNAPEWCDFTVYRWNTRAQQKIEFTVRVYFAEVVALKDGRANERWKKAPVQMLTKCAEAAALREAFPDEFGGEMTAEEMSGQAPIEGESVIGKPVVAMPKSKAAAAEQPAIEHEPKAPAVDPEDPFLKGLNGETTREPGED